MNKTGEGGEGVEPYEIVREHRDRWVKRFDAAAHDDDAKDAEMAAQVVIALTRCFWDVLHKELSPED